MVFGKLTSGFCGKLLIVESETRFTLAQLFLVLKSNFLHCLVKRWHLFLISPLVSLAFGISHGIFKRLHFSLSACSFAINVLAFIIIATGVLILFAV